jgi:prepilin-type N-terminal cleavage/methylation domain-containing protein
MPLKCQLGFTLAELLIALAILGEIATFTIPKILSAQQDGRNRTIAKEVAGMISEAYGQHKLASTPTSSFKPIDLLPYFNYVKYDTTITIDEVHTQGSAACSTTYPCIKLHNGAVLMFESGSFSGTATTNAIAFKVDPDGKVTDGTTNGPGKSLNFWLYYNGRLSTHGAIASGTVASTGTYNPNSAYDPPWFSW